MRFTAGKKTHIEHTVRFIEHENLDVVETSFALLHQIDQPPRRCDDDVGTTAHGIDLRFHGHASVNRRDAQFSMFCQLPKMLRDLLRQLASRRQDQRCTAAGAPLEQFMK